MKKTNIFLCFYLLSFAIGHSQITPGSRADILKQRYLHPISDDANRVWIMAHRGAWNEANPESSLGAFQRSIDLKFEILELDVLFSSSFNIINGVQGADKNGTNREIVLIHDQSPNRSGAIGLYNFNGSHTFTDAAYLDKKGQKTGFTRLENLVQFSSSGVNSIDGSGGEHPFLLKLDGTNSTWTMLHFPNNATTSNTDFGNFYSTVKDKILLNLDKLAKPLDFQQVYDLFSNVGLLEQSIFKAKGIRKFKDVETLFGVARNLSKVMFTPIFTRWDFCYEINFNGIPINDINPATNTPYDYNSKLAIAKACIDDMIAAENDGLIIFPGCELVYESDNVNTDWLAALAQYVQSKGKRIVQFSTIMESKSGGWNGNGNKWSSLQGRQVNYWSWLFNNATIKNSNITPSVFVGDKPIEFRSYLNALGYNQTPIE
jgi:hypothetical protein